MPLLESGRDFIAAAIINDGPPTFFTNANAHIAVGNGNDAFDAEDTDLQGGSKVREPVDGGYPQRTLNVLTLQATYDEGTANFAWEEWGVANHVSAGVLLNRQVESLGTKADTQSWVFLVDLEFVIGELPE